MVRDQRKTPEALLNANRPCSWWYQARYRTSGTAPAATAAVTARQPARRTIMTSTSRTSSGRPTGQQTADAPSAAAAVALAHRGRWASGHQT